MTTTVKREMARDGCAAMRIADILLIKASGIRMQ